MGKKAPGCSHREGISIMELFEMFPDDATAEKWFERQRWPNDIPGVHDRPNYRVPPIESLSVTALST